MTPLQTSHMRPSDLRSLVVTVGVVLAASLAPGAPGLAQAPARTTPPGWGALTPTHPVGFRVLRVDDPFRPYGPLPGTGDWAFGPRPLQLAVWYPATDAATAEPAMPMGELVRLLATELAPEGGSSAAMAEAERDPLYGRINSYIPEGESEETALARLLAMPTLARRDAPPARGPWPVVLHTGVAYTQALLNEYLASQGYVVVGVPLMGTSPAWRGRGQPGPEMWEAVARDLAVAAVRVSELDFADGERTAVVGMLSGSGLLYAMRDPGLDAVALLDAWIPDDLRGLPGWSPPTIRIPLLELRNTVPGRSDGDVLDQMTHAPGWRVRLDSLTHPDFYPFPRYMVPDRADQLYPAYAVIARYTHAFLDSALKGDVEAGEWLSRDPATHPSPAVPGTVEPRSVTPAAPRPETLLTWARYGRAGDLLAEVRAARERDPAALPVDPGALLTVARFLWRDGERAEAVEAARAVLLLDPDNEIAGQIVEAGSAG